MPRHPLCAGDGDNTLHTRMKHSIDTHGAERCAASTAGDVPVLLDASDVKEPCSGIEFFDIDSFDLMREFVEHVAIENARDALGGGERPRGAIDWDEVKVAIAGAPTLENALGRAVVIADQMSRGLIGGELVQDAPVSASTTNAPSLPEASVQSAEDPFFAFSMADVVPDFGDESRYRWRVARKMARLFGARRVADEAGGELTAIGNGAGPPPDSERLALLT